MDARIRLVRLLARRIVRDQLGRRPDNLDVPPPAHPPGPERQLVAARTIKVSYAKPWLASEAELDDYLRKQREAWLKEIQAGNRVQI